MGWGIWGEMGERRGTKHGQGGRGGHIEEEREKVIIEEMGKGQDIWG